MNTINIILLIVLIVSILAIFYVNSYNKLMYQKTKTNRALEVINNTLDKKLELIKEANTLIKKVTKSKKEYLKDFINPDEHKLSNYDLDRNLDSAFKIIKDLEGDNESLQKSKKFKELLKEFKDNEEKLCSAKSYFNKNTAITNGLIKKFPDMIVARIHGIRIKAYFDSKELIDEVDVFKL